MIFLLILRFFQWERDRLPGQHSQLCAAGLSSATVGGRRERRGDHEPAQTPREEEGTDQDPVHNRP